MWTKLGVNQSHPVEQNLAGATQEPPGTIQPVPPKLVKPDKVPWNQSSQAQQGLV